MKLLRRGKLTTPALVMAFSIILLWSGCIGSKSRLKVGTSSEGEVVEAVGFAPDNTSDQMATKASSLADAQRKAVEKVVGVYVSARTLVEKAVAIEDNILSQTEGYVKKYDVLNEWVEGGLYKTKIRALVAYKDLEADLKSLSLLDTPELKRPRVLVSLKEKIDNKESTEEAAKRSLENKLTEQGFVVVSNDRKKEAELLIDGKVSSLPFKSKGLGGFVSYRARLSAKATRLGTKDVVVSYSREASGLGGNKDLAGLKALEVVGELAGTEMGEKITQSWAGGRNLLIFVEGATSFSEVERVRKHLSSRPGVNDIMLRLYDDDLAQFEVQLGKIDATKLASDISSSKSMNFDVLEASPQNIRLKLNQN